MFVSVQPSVISVSTVLGGATPPDAPTSLAAAQSDTGPSLSWTSAETSFKIYRDGVLLDTDTASPYIDTTAVSGVEYDYTVTAVRNGLESVASNTATFTWWAPIEDTFNRTSSDLAGDTPDTLSNGNTWQQRSGGTQTLQCDTTTGGSSAGRCYPSTDGQTPTNIIDFENGNMKITGKGQFRSGGAGSREMRIYGRCESSQFTDWWGIFWSRVASDATAPTFILYEFTSSVLTNRGSYGSAHTTGERTIIWTMNGNNHTVNYEGTDVITYSSASHTDHTFGGLMVYEQTTNNGGTHWTLFRIETP